MSRRAYFVLWAAVILSVVIADLVQRRAALPTLLP